MKWSDWLCQDRCQREDCSRYRSSPCWSHTSRIDCKCQLKSTPVGIRSTYLQQLPYLEPLHVKPLAPPHVPSFDILAGEQEGIAEDDVEG